ncbi:putative membrane protein [Escherichia coli 2720900]|nr:putative membrane protein [Escherichia coli 2720900]
MWFYLCDKSKPTNSVLISFLFLLILCLSCFYLILYFFMCILF